MDKPPQPPGAIKAQTFKRRTTKVFSADYLLFLPKDYGGRDTRRWPLILFLHGAGERGRPVRSVAKQGPLTAARENPDFPFVIVAPQCRPGQCWADDELMTLLEEVTRKHRIDEGRIYLTGLSMGGYGVWSLALAGPERFAAIAPICGGGSLIKLLLRDRPLAPRLKAMAVWAFHGAQDDVVPLAESERMVNAWRGLGGEVKFTVYQDANHDSWTETYRNPALYDWFLRHRRRLK